jgi:hypothetical protein
MSRSKQRHAVEAGVPVPPPDPRPYVPTITLPGNRETAFLALHSSAVGFLMHWVDKQHLPHPKDRHWCAGCKSGQTPQWTGFLGVISLNTMNRFILRIPAAAFRESGEFREKSDAGLLTGTVFTAWRFGKTNCKTNPAVIEIVRDNVPTPKMNEFPLIRALCRYWRMETADGIVEVKRPEDAQAVLAAEFVTLAQHWKETRQKGKEAQG